MDNLDWEDISNRNNSPILPRSIRGLIVGKSGCGKTNLFLNLLLKPELLDYNELFVYGKSLFQSKCKILQCGFDNNLNKECVYNLFKSRKNSKDKDIAPYKLIKEIGETCSNDNSLGNTHPIALVLTPDLGSSRSTGYGMRNCLFPSRPIFVQ